MKGLRAMVTIDGVGYATFVEASRNIRDFFSNLHRRVETTSPYPRVGLPYLPTSTRDLQLF